ncbi:MAG TPA: methyltransferase domain-containing protein [Candidatus Hydrogenedentes bacterium]|nr:methyltransferase domain-containing protein [Candidatus Hydrogenedentota bacterium]HPG68228.1 methyltransferase domain-containing protein [Candidatus Hydrogenedentota bacterium]
MRHSIPAEDSRVGYRRFHARRHRQFLDLLARHCPQSVARCLDIGGGGDAGGMAEEIRARFAHALHAVDLGVDVALGRARGVLAEECNIDRDALPYADGFFGLVLFASVIEHLYHPRHVMSEVARVLAPGGLLVVEAPNAVALGRRLDALAGRNPFATFNRYNAVEDKGLMVECSVFYTPEEIVAMIASDFEVLECCYGMHTPPAHAVKRLVREVAFRLRPRLGDCFFVIARRR